MKQATKKTQKTAKETITIAARFRFQTENTDSDGREDPRVSSVAYRQMYPPDTFGAPKKRALLTPGASPRVAGEKSEFVNSFSSCPKIQIDSGVTDQSRRSYTETDRQTEGQRHRHRCWPAYLPVGTGWSLGQESDDLGGTSK